MTRTTFTIAALATTFLAGAGSLFLSATEAEARSRHRHFNGPGHHFRYQHIHQPEVYVFRPVKRLKRKKVRVMIPKTKPVVVMTPANTPASPAANQPAANQPVVNQPAVTQTTDVAKSAPNETSNSPREMKKGDCMEMCAQADRAMDTVMR